METRYPVISCGPDWLTVTGKNESKALSLQLLGERLLREKRKAGEFISPASRLRYQGLATTDFFVGTRHDGTMVMTSGLGCVPLAEELIAACDNVSRLDLQVTLDCGYDAPYLAHEAFSRLRAYHAQHKITRALNLNAGYPHGATLSLNKRCSTNYGRFYDKSVEAKCGAPRTVWRAECEFKRDAARKVAAQVTSGESLTASASSLVFAWWSDRGLDLPFSPVNSGWLDQSAGKVLRLGHLEWFRTKVSKSVLNSLKRYGVSRTVDALGLGDYVQVLPEFRENSDG